jgi:hypothetical protein
VVALVDLAREGVHAGRAGRVEVDVQQHVEHREHDLAQRASPLWKFFAAIILSNSARGSARRFPRATSSTTARPIPSRSSP